MKRSVSLLLLFLCFALLFACGRVEKTSPPNDTVRFRRDDDTLRFESSGSALSFAELVPILAKSTAGNALPAGTEPLDGAGWAFSETGVYAPSDPALLLPGGSLYPGQKREEALAALFSARLLASEGWRGKGPSYPLYDADEAPCIELMNGGGGSFRFSGLYAGLPFEIGRLAYETAADGTQTLDKIFLKFPYYPGADDAIARWVTLRDLLTAQLGAADDPQPHNPWLSYTLEEICAQEKLPYQLGASWRCGEGELLLYTRPESGTAYPAVYLELPHTR